MIFNLLKYLKHTHTHTHTHTTILRPFFRDHPGDRCQRRTSGLYGAMED